MESLEQCIFFFVKFLQSGDPEEKKKKKPPSVNCANVFLIIKNEKKNSPFIEEKKSYVAIFRQ
jgi:hypothetical protein